MPVYTTPGVYVEEVLGAPPISGVGTSTAAIFGEVDDDGLIMPFVAGSDVERYPPPTPDVAVPVTKFEQFKKHFGDFQAGNSTLAYAVYGFFLNGGTKCYVVAVDDLDALTDALDAVARIDEVAIVLAPGARSQAAQDAIVNHCVGLEDRFAILDGQETETITVDGIKGATANSDYAALYFPDIVVSDLTRKMDGEDDPGEGAPVPGATLTIPPRGHVAGLYARVDASRGVHKAPANENVRGALNLAYSVTHEEQGDLNDLGINVIRSFTSGIKVWGARTLGGRLNGEFRYVNVRRLFLFLRESIDEGTQFAVFEPNAQLLWEKIKRSVSGFLTNVWRDGALFGATPKQAFFVRCDETINPYEVRIQGQVITEIGVAPVTPAEFVVFRISQSAGSPS